MEMHGIVGNKFPMTKSIIIYVHTHTYHQKVNFFEMFSI